MSEETNNAKRPKRTPSTGPRRAPGVIEPEAVYTREEFIARAGLRDESFRQAKRNGLRVISKHKRVYVLGRDWINYLTLDK